MVETFPGQDAGILRCALNEKRHLLKPEMALVVSVSFVELQYQHIPLRCTHAHGHHTATHHGFIAGESWNMFDLLNHGAKIEEFVRSVQVFSCCVVCDSL